MEVLYPRCAVLDVQKDTVVAAVRCVSAPRQPRKQRPFAGRRALQRLVLLRSGHNESG